MVKTLLIVLIVLAVIVGGFAVFVAMRPAEFRVERSATIAAPASDVFAQVNDFHKWAAWSPWAKLDPKADNSFEGADSGQGAIFQWSGNKEVGEGRMTITESRPNDQIKIKLDFVRPFEDTSTTEFNFKADGNQTVVAWSMYGRHTFMSKGMCLFMSMDKMIGDNFEEGLASMKSVVEAKK